MEAHLATSRPTWLSSCCRKASRVTAWNCSHWTWYPSLGWGSAGLALLGTPNLNHSMRLPRAFPIHCEGDVWTEVPTYQCIIEQACGGSTFQSQLLPRASPLLHTRHELSQNAGISGFCQTYTVLPVNRCNEGLCWCKWALMCSLCKTPTPPCVPPWPVSVAALQWGYQPFLHMACSADGRAFSNLQSYRIAEFHWVT